MIADIVPPRSIAESLVEALATVEVEGRPVLIARAREARDVLPDALAETGPRSTWSALYETVARSPTLRRSRPRPSADYITFTSSSTVRNLRRGGRRSAARRPPGSSRSAR